MTPTRPRTLVLIVILAAAVLWTVFKVAYASLPPLTWTAVPALLIAAVAEGWTARDLRARIQGRAGARPAPALYVARLVAVAKATSQTASLIIGACLGAVIYLSGMIDAPTPHSDLVDASLTLGSALILLAAALFLEHCCRVPKPPGRDAYRDTAPPPSPFDH